MKSNYLIRNKKSGFDKLSITYDNKQIEDLCVSKITIWNSGNTTLNSTDIVKDKELTITALEDTTILDAEIIFCSEETNKFRVKIIDEHTAKLYFDYVDKKDGMVVQVIHTGSANDIRIDCKIKGGEKIKTDNPEIPAKEFLKFYNNNFFKRFSLIYLEFLIILFLLLSIILIVSLFIPDLQNILFNTTPHKPPQSLIILFSIVFFVSSVLLETMYIPLIKRVFNMGIPKKLKEF